MKHLNIVFTQYFELETSKTIYQAEIFKIKAGTLKKVQSCLQAELEDENLMTFTSDSLKDLFGKLEAYIN